MNKHKTIELPYLYDIDHLKEKSTLLTVTHESPTSMKKAAELMAHYLKREIHTDFSQYSSETDGKKPHVKSYIWIDYDWSGVFVIGACGFRKNQSGNELEWVWIHPYYRGRGLLTAAWPIFLKEYGDGFSIMEPLRFGMDGFIKSMYGDKKC